MTRTRWCREEFAHTALHNGTEYAAGCRGQAEIEAESVAYIICQAAGLTAAAYSFGYVAHWAGGDQKAIRETADRVITAARTILDNSRLLVIEEVSAADPVAA